MSPEHNLVICHIVHFTWQSTWSCVRASSGVIVRGHRVSPGDAVLLWKKCEFDNRYIIDIKSCSRVFSVEQWCHCQRRPRNKLKYLLGYLLGCRYLLHTSRYLKFTCSFWNFLIFWWANSVKYTVGGRRVNKSDAYKKKCKVWIYLLPTLHKKSLKSPNSMH